MPQFYILLAIFLWSSLGIIFRRAAVPVHVFLFYSLLSAVIFQTLYAWRKGLMRDIAGQGRLKAPLLLGLVGLVNALTFIYAFEKTTISNAVLTHYTAPVIVAFLAAVFLRERITVTLVAAIVLSSAGLWIMLGRLSLQSGHMTGIISGLVSGFAYAVLIIIARNYSGRYHPFMLTYMVNVTIAACLAPFIRELPLHAIWIFVGTGIVHYMVAPVLYYEGLKTVSAGRTAVLGYLEPVCAILLGMVFLGEMPGQNSLAGGAMILFSGYLVIRSGS